MPYADPAIQKAVQRSYYQSTKDKQREREARRRLERIRWFGELKKGLACPCGEGHPACIDFHHRDPETKDGQISMMVQHGYAITTIMNEIAKCDVLCSNCHRKLHYKDTDEARILAN